jgi:hypothetical protein
MTWFWIPLVVVGFAAFVYISTSIRAAWAIPILFIALTSIPIMLCIDTPAQDRKNVIPPGTCITCKMELHGTLYAIGCDGHEYQPNVSAWALLNVRECK